MPSYHSDRNLLFGILALQMDFISRDALVAAMHAWILDKAKPLGQILREQGHLAEDEHDLLEAMVRKHLARHDHDPQQSLGAIQSDGSLHQELQQLADADLHSSLAHVSAACARDADTTRTYAAPGTVPPQARFLILRPHARGGLGEVFVARDEELKREVALKEIQQRHADSPESRVRFLLEAEVTGSLEHPGIVPVYGLGAYADGRPFYAMRFIKGDSLKDAIAAFHAAEQNGRPDSERSLALRQLLGRFVAVCQAIAYAHSRGVLHRDLKPGNIMLGKYGETLVVDWGLAKVLGQADVEATEGAVGSSGDSSLTQTGRALGTPAFMSPEQARGNLSKLGPASDVYSLGATLYCLLTGQAPFLESDAGVVLGKVQRGDFPPPRRVNPRVPAALEAVCLKAMALAPEDRYPSPRDLAGEVERWLADEPVRAHRERWPARLARVGRKRPALTAGIGALLVTGVIALSVSTLLIGQAERDTARALSDLKAEQQHRILTQLDALRTAVPEAVPGILGDLRVNRSQVLSGLRALYASEQDRGLRARLALALVEVEPETVRAELAQWLVQAEDPAEGRLVRDALTPHAGDLKEGLWRQARDADQPAVRFRALAALAAFDADNPAWKGHGPLAAEQMMQANPLHLGVWLEAFRPVRQALRPTLEEVFRGQKLKESRQAAATVLADYLADEPAQLAELLLDANDPQFALLLPLRAKAEPALGRLVRELKPAGAAKTEAEQSLRARRQAAAALALWRLGKPEPTWALWRHTPTPEARSWLVQRAAAVGVDAQQLIDRLGREQDVSAKRALILALGEYTEKDLAAAVRQPLVTQLLGWYRDDPDPGIHGAIDWLLRHGKEGPVARPLDWGQREALERIDAELAARARAEASARAAGRIGLAGSGPWPALAPCGFGPARAGKGRVPSWRVNGQGMTFVVIPGPVEFLMGSPESEAGHEAIERQHWQRIDRSYELATKLVTVWQWKQFLKERPKIPSHYGKQYSPEESCPINNLTWFRAAAFCNWLSEKEGIPKDQWYYPEDIGEGRGVAAGQGDRTGYRLPTEAEWEYACRAGAVTSRYYGSSEELLGRYGIHRANSQMRTWPVGQKRPNDLGLFDLHGSLGMWCQTGETVILGDKPVYVNILRGGSFTNHPLETRSAARSRIQPFVESGYFGVLVCRTYP
ncbi:MAG: SUMF1/EgtB/PvdO family nonheme iron enzyme [Gemmataceae bacterium]|nr:SUMF1/EgtB/PvdO family nonheme iron enzyme [Gemmataceae bacterium]